MTTDLTQYVTTAQAAKMMGVWPEHVNHLLIAGKIKGQKFGPTWMVFTPSVEQYQATKSTKGRPPSRT